MANDARINTRLIDEISAYGATREHVRLFGGKPGPEHQEYLDLIAARDSDPDAPDGVAEAQGRPILYFIDQTRLAGILPEAQVVDGIRRRLACRGERAYLARVEPGRIHVAPVAFEDVPVDWREYIPNSVEGRTLFSRLVNGVVDWDQDIARGDAVFGRLRLLLMHSARRLAETEELRPDVLSLLGRALFFRFLRDRRIIKEASISQVAPRANTWKDCFDGPVNTAATCRWLDETFNGDFLPLSGGGGEEYFNQIDKITKGDVFNHLTAVILGAEAKGNVYQLTFDWGTLDFAHVPVGLLSQVYEDFCWHWEREEAETTSVHYTPRNIALTLLDEAFEGIRSPEEAKVLDPACGAGVFLVLAFRKIYRKVWESSGKRPGRRTVRRILNRQLAGFDVSENALRLAALSLYLTALELDPVPQPLSELRFDNLRENVLFTFRRVGKDSPTGPVIGSIGDSVEARHNGNYDIVLSNPPWTSVPAELGAKMEEATRAVLRRAGSEGADDYENPYHNPDLPFLFRSTEWCKKGGRIAMALPARLLLKNRPIPAAARRQLFHFINITGIISGVNLAKTRVWPGTDLPFILLFAQNESPPEHPRTHLVCPHYDADLNGRGEFRIDADASRLVNPLEADAEPWLWKGWLVGSSLDVEIVRKVLAHPGSVKVADYWHEKGMAHGQGCIVSPGNRTQYDTTALRGLPFLSARTRFPFIVQPESLEKFDRATLHMPRRRDIYRSPLVLLKQSPGTDRRRGVAYLAFNDIVYVESYYGFSAQGYPQDELLARYLHLLVHTNIYLHFGLITGAQFGAERNKFQKQTIEDFPMIRFENLDRDQRKQVSDLSDRLVGGDKGVFEEIDCFFAHIHGLDSDDLEVIRDTLDVGQAYRESSGERACAPPTLAECKRFVDRLRDLIAPLLGVDPDNLPATLWFPPDSDQASQTFGAVLLGRPINAITERAYFDTVLPLADDTGASQVLMEHDGGGLLVGLRNQYRYWTQTRARLLAADIVREYLDSIGL